ncbi:MAG: DUF6044 family protein [Dysgonomonas sp.]
MSFGNIDVVLNKKKNVLILSFTFLVIFSLPFLLLGGDMVYDCYDNLDSNVIWRKLLLDNNLLFADSYTIVEQMMSGIPRISLGTELNMFVLLAKIFSPGISLGVNRVLQIMIGFIGMFLLCKKYIFTGARSNLLSAFVAIFFAILPFWSSGCLSIAGQPLVLYAFLNIKNKDSNKWDWIIMILYPFTTIFIVFGLFFYSVLFIIFCIDLYQKKRINFPLLFALLILTVLSLITMYREILSFLVETDFVSHRTEASRTYGAKSLHGVWEKMQLHFTTNTAHASSNHLYILILAIIAILWAKIKGIVPKELLLALSIFVIIVIYTSFISWGRIYNLIHSVELFRLVSIHRFFTLLPLVTFIILAYALNVFADKKYVIIILVLFGIVQLNYSLKQDYSYYNWIKRTLKKENTLQTITFNEFYSEDLFKQIRDDIGQPTKSYRVVALGFHPSVLQYNGFYTIDGFSGNYDVKYKHLFCKLLNNELDKNEEIKAYMYTFSHRCYIFSSECGLELHYGHNYKNTKNSIESLDIDYEIAKSLNCKYIISSIKIKNLKSNLLLQNIYQNKAWKIYLYQIY